MKRLLLIILTCLFFTGCREENKSTPSSSEPVAIADESSKLKVVASFYPMVDFAEKIGGEAVDVYTMVPSGIDAHDWEPSATDIIILENCDVFIYHGGGMEHWVESALAAIDTSNMVIVEASHGISLAEGQYHADPHTWLNINNAILSLENIKDGLLAKDPKNADIYESNFEHYQKEFTDLHNLYTTTLDDKVRDKIVVSHPAFLYICIEFGLTMYSLEDAGAHSEPNPRDIADVINVIEEYGIPVIFYGGNESTKGIETIQKATGVVTLPLYSLESITKEQMENGEDYLSLMKKNLESLAQALL